MVSLITHCLGMLGILGKHYFSWVMVELVKRKQEIETVFHYYLYVCQYRVILIRMGKSYQVENVSCYSK